MTRYVIYTDGSCLPMGAGGGAAICITTNDDDRETCTSAIGVNRPNTTNNTMELLAIYIGLARFALEPGAAVDVYTDSQYAIGALSQPWKLRKAHHAFLRDATRRLIETRDLQVTYHHVAGHTGNKWNERCDRISRRFAVEVEPKCNPGTERI